MITHKESSFDTGFSLQDVLDGKVECSVDDWFSAFEKAVLQTVHTKMAGSTPKETSQFVALSYLACSSYAFHNEPRELAEKTYPHFQMVILDLQKEFRPFGLLLEAAQKQQFKKDLRSGLSNVEAVDIARKRFRNAFDRSEFPQHFKTAEMEIVWD